MKSGIENYWIETLAAFTVSNPVDLRESESTFGIQIYSLMAILGRYYTTDHQIKAASLLSKTDTGILRAKLYSGGKASSTGYNLSLIEIIKVPEGDAPTKERKEWVGLTLPVLHVPKGQFKEADFLSGQDTPERDVVLTLAIPALFELEKKSPEAADWFLNNFTMGIFSFGEDEVKVIDKL